MTVFRHDYRLYKLRSNRLHSTLNLKRKCKTHALGGTTLVDGDDAITTQTGSTGLSDIV